MEKDLIEFFIYLRDECHNRDFNMEPKRVVECFRDYQSEGYKLPIDNVVVRSEQLPESEKLCRMNQNFVCNCIDDSRCPNF